MPCPQPFATRRCTAWLQEAHPHQMQAPAVHQGSEMLQVHLCAVQHLLDMEQGLLGAHATQGQYTRTLGAPQGPVHPIRCHHDHP